MEKPEQEPGRQGRKSVLEMSWGGGGAHSRVQGEVF